MTEDTEQLQKRDRGARAGKPWWETFGPPLITGAAAIAAAFIVTGALASLASAAPQVRLSSSTWGGANSAYSVSGDVRDLGDHVVWAFSSRADGTRGVYPADAACSTSDTGSFSCEGWAGDSSEVGDDFQVTVVVLPAGAVGTVSRLAEQNGFYTSLSEIPAADGAWAIHTAPLTAN